MAENRFDRFVQGASALVIPLVLAGAYLLSFLSSALEPEDALQILPRYVRVGAELQAPGSKPAGEPPAPVEDQVGAATESSAEMRADQEVQRTIDLSARPVAVAVGGKVLHDWEPVRGAAVWVRLIGANANSYLVGATHTSEQGEFAISGIVESADQRPPAELRIDAKTESVDGEQATALLGQTAMLLGKSTYQHRVRASLWAVFGLPAVFFLSLWVAFLETRPGFGRRLKYLGALTLAFMFTVCMIYGVAMGLSSVQDLEGQGEVLSLGYGFLFRGTYVADGTPEWIYSFTAPRLHEESGAAVRAVATGFGAPLWVILLSVIGAAVATVSLLVVATKDPPNTNDDSAPAKLKFGERIQQIVEHQFFILFAPLGAIFVYQLLVAADGAGKSVTVALAALGSGPVLNYLLAQAIEKAKGLVQPAAAEG